MYGISPPLVLLAQGHLLLDVVSLLPELLHYRLPLSSATYAPGIAQKATYSKRLGVDAILNHGDTYRQGPAVQVAVLRLSSVKRSPLFGKRRWASAAEAGRTSIVEISCRTSTACWAAACLLVRSSAIFGVVNGDVGGQ